MIDGIRALLDRHLPGYEVRSVAKLGEGLDNAAYEVNGELIVRRSKEADPVGRSESTGREAALLVLASVAVGQRTRVRKKEEAPPPAQAKAAPRDL